MIDLIIGWHKAWRQVFKSMWKDFDSTFKAILDNLKRHSGLIDRLARAIQMEQLQKDSLSLSILISEYKMDQDNRLRKLQREEAERKRVLKHEVLQWVAGASMSERHESSCKARQYCPGSGDWVLEGKQLKDWKDADTPNNSVLWLHGIPGAGKPLRILDGSVL